MSDRLLRSIYYLGGKTGSLDAIRRAVDDVDPGRGRLCDLFAGSGVVGGNLASDRDVTAIDIQEYSRVISNCLLNPDRIDADAIHVAVREVATRRDRTLGHIASLVRFEEEAVENAASGDTAPIVGILESPPLALWTSDEESAAFKVRRDAVRRLLAAELWSDTTIVLRHYGGIYFSYQQAATLDAAIAYANESATSSRRDSFLAAAMMTASAIVNTVGKQFAQPLRPRSKDGNVKSALARIIVRDRSMDALNALEQALTRLPRPRRRPGRHRAIKADFLEGLRKEAPSLSVVYADPPYTRDHYSRFYHVLETMALNDDPKISTVKKGGIIQPSRGLYRLDRHQSPFCIRSKAPAALAALFRTTKDFGLPVVLSYSPHETGDGTHPRVMSTRQIMDVAKSFYSKVEIEAIPGIVHNVFNNESLKLNSRLEAEVLIKCCR